MRRPWGKREPLTTDAKPLPQDALRADGQRDRERARSKIDRVIEAREEQTRLPPPKDTSVRGGPLLFGYVR